MRKLTVILCVLAVAGCGINRPVIDSVADAIAVTAADIETAAQTAQRLCGNTVPDGPCRPGALLDTGTKDEIKNQLQDALDYLSDANRALAADEGARASGFLNRAEALLVVVEAVLREREL